MRTGKTWVAAGAAAVLGAGATTTAASALQDRSTVPAPAGAVELNLVEDAQPGDQAAAVDDSPESADRPNASAVESADSPATAPARVTSQSVDSPASAPAPRPGTATSPDSASSPDSPDSADSA